LLFWIKQKIQVENKAVTVKVTAFALLLSQRCLDDLLHSGRDVHGILGLLTIILMLGHALWATYVLVKKDEKMIVSFHKFSVFVWLVWLIPYLSPMFFQMVMSAN